METMTRQQAKEAGLTRYFTGKPCKHGHVAERRMSDGCVVCADLHARAWQAANPDKVKAKSRAYHRKNADIRSEKFRQWREANPEKMKAATAAWREANPVRVKALRDAWKKANYGKVLAYNAKRQAAKLQATPAWADQQKIEEYYITVDGLGMLTGDAYHVDHIVPLQHQRVCGLHVEHNLQILPAFDNRVKSNRHWPGM